ncbi:MAG: hypothetical protein ACE15C_04460 [Phycisphaerae bacterium]
MKAAGLFPYFGNHENVQEATVRLRKPELFHKFEFEGPGGQKLTGRALQNVCVVYVPAEDAEGKVALEADCVRDGGKLLPGKYVASCPGEVEYLPLEVAEDSPETLLFRLPPPVTYRGLVTDGATGKPLKEAFVFGYASTSHNNLAMLSDEDWKTLEAMPAKPSLDDAGVKRIGKMYGVLAMVRTDSDGRYEIEQPVDKKFYGLVAFARDRLPYTHRTYKLKPDDKQLAAVPDLPLFPAAKVIVKPVAKGHLSVSPKWVFAGDGQPDWFKKLKDAMSVGLSEAKVEYVHWLKLNEAQPIYVPADVRLRIAFEVPYDGDRCPARIPAVSVGAPRCGQACPWPIGPRAI